jgi:cell division protein ZapA
MAHVTVKINGYGYTVGCEDGQEQHLLAMAQQVESRIDSIKALGGNSGEAKLLVLAALLMADEIHDLRIEMDGLRAAVNAARAARPKVEGKIDPELARKLSHLTMRAEQIASSLEQPS